MPLVKISDDDVAGIAADFVADDDDSDKASTVSLVCEASGALAGTRFQLYGSAVLALVR